MAIDSNIALGYRGLDAVTPARQGFQLGAGIAQNINQTRDRKKQEAQDRAIKAFSAWGSDQLTEENLPQFNAVIAEMGYPPVKDIAKAQTVLTAGGNLFNQQMIASGKGQAQGADEYDNYEEVDGVLYATNKTKGIREQVPSTPEARRALAEQSRKKAEDAKLESQWSKGNELRKEYENKVKEQQATIDSYATFDAIKKSDAQIIEQFKSNYAAFAEPVDSNGNPVEKERILKDAQALSDIALIFAYFKMVDPRSTVREGEFATVENAGSVATRYQNLYNRLLTGERLNEAQRQQIFRLAQNKYNSAADTVEKQRSRYKGLAEKGGVDVDLFAFEGINRPSAAMSAQDEQAKIWLESNPNDPRAVKVQERLKAKYGRF